MDTEKARAEEFRVSGAELLAKFKELVEEGKVRRVVIKNEVGKVLVDIPLTVGVVGAVVAPQAAAVGAIAALLTHCTVVVERVEE
jgi:hypothetical protein